MEAQAVTQQSSPAKEYPMRIVSVVFGNPRSPECAGYGVCRLDEDGDVPWPPKPPQKGALFTACPRYRATIERVEAANGKVHLSFNFLKADLNAEVVKTYFSDTHFTIGSALQLPNSLTKAFDMDPSVLTAGLYQITDKKTYFSIQIQTT